MASVIGLMGVMSVVGVMRMIGVVCVICELRVIGVTGMKGVIGGTCMMMEAGDENNLSCSLLHVGKNVNSYVCNTSSR